MQTYAITKISAQRGTPRIWLEGSRLALAGFSPASRYRLQVDPEARRLTLRVAADGDRLVSRREKAGKALPIIDICNGGLLAIFAGLQRVRVVFSDRVVHILPVASEARRIERESRLRERLAAGQPLAVGSLSTGVGVLSLAVHEGLESAGLASRLALACDIDPDYLAQAEAKNPAWCRDTIMVAAPLQEVAFDPWAARKLPRVDVLESGIPCTAHSIAGQSKKGLNIPEADSTVGHLSAGWLAWVAILNPAAIVLENVPGYLTSASFAIIKNQLTEWGYKVSAAVLAGKEFNAMENRERMALVAVSDGIEFSFDTVERPEPAVRRLGDLLDDVPPDSPVWSEMLGLKLKEAKDKAAGKGFMMQIFDEDSTHVSTIGRGYAKVRSTEPKIRNPQNPDLLRQLSPDEHCRVKGINPILTDGMSATRAHEVLGQSVLPAVFSAVAKALGLSLRKWFAGLPSVEPTPFALVA